MAFNDQEEFVYETDEEGNKMLVRSLTSSQRVYLRFTNRTDRAVDVWWRNFRGARVHYIRLKAFSSFDVNSFVTHPWEFTDVGTRENYVIENKRFFRPTKEFADSGFRSNWNITVGLRSLRHTALLTLAREVVNPCAVGTFELPKTLEDELRKMIMMYNSVITPFENR